MVLGMLGMSTPITIQLAHYTLKLNIALKKSKGIMLSGCQQDTSAIYRERLGALS